MTTTAPRTTTARAPKTARHHIMTAAWRIYRARRPATGPGAVRFHRRAFGACLALAWRRWRADPAERPARRYRPAAATIRRCTFRATPTGPYRTGPHRRR